VSCTGGKCCHVFVIADRESQWWRAVWCFYKASKRAACKQWLEKPATWEEKEEMNVNKGFPFKNLYIAIVALVFSPYLLYSLHFRLYLCSTVVFLSSRMLLSSLASVRRVHILGRLQAGWALKSTQSDGLGQTMPGWIDLKRHSEFKISNTPVCTAGAVCIWTCLDRWPSDLLLCICFNTVWSVLCKCNKAIVHSRPCWNVLISWLGWWCV